MTATTTGRSRRARPSRASRDEDCALREVEEETGLRCALGEELAVDGVHGRARAPEASSATGSWSRSAGELEYRHEVDAARWVPLDEARGVLTYQRDVALLDGIASHLT